MLIKRLSILAFLVAIFVVVLGAYTRLVDAGLGCPDWPTCYGHLWIPSSIEDIKLANERFKETPVETSKTWPEQIHRIFASSLGLVILSIFTLAFIQLKKERKDKAPSKKWFQFEEISIVITLSVLVLATVARIVFGDILDVPLLLLVIVYFGNLFKLSKTSLSQSIPFKLIACLSGLVVLQGLFGMWTVTLKLWPQVVTTHLLGGFATLSLIWLLIQRLFQWQWSVQIRQFVFLSEAKPLTYIAFGAVIAQIALGGWLSSNYAALACPDFPFCQNQIWPKSDFAQGFNLFQTIGPNYLGGLLTSDARTAIHLTHRIGAILVAILVFALALKLWTTQYAEARIYAFVLLAILLVQISLGVMNIVLSLPLWVAVSHNAGGAMLLLVLVTLLHRIHNMKQV